MPFHPSLPRRGFLKGLSAGALALSGLRVLGAENPIPSTKKWLETFRLLRVGTMGTKSAKAIKASPLSVGMECLDRRMYDPEKTYDHLAALGVKWARVQTGWARCETEQGRYNFRWLDGIVDSIRATGVQPWFNVGYGNQLYTPDAPDPAAVGWAPIVGNESRQAWARFVTALAAHFRDRVQHWEIWNEPNIYHFWQPAKPSAAGYMDLVKLTASAIRSRLPDAVLIGGGFSAMPTEFLAGCLELGLAEEVQKVSYHPYALIPEKGYVEAVATWRSLLARHSSSLALWQGECGCPSSEGGVGALAQHRWNEERQAKWFLRRTLLDLSLGLELISYFHLVDLVRYHWSGRTVLMTKDKAPRTNFRADFGLLRGDDYTRKPSFHACQRLCALFDAGTKPAAFAARFTGGSPAMPAEATIRAGFSRGAAPLFAYWWPGDVQKDPVTQEVALTLTVPTDFTLREPVLLDPLEGGVYRLTGTQRTREWTFGKLPLADYPFLITDGSLVASAAH